MNDIVTRKKTIDPNAGKEMVKALHESQAKQRKNNFNNSTFGKKWNETVFFATFIVSFLFASLVIACGAYAAYKGVKSTYALAHVGLVVAGSASVAAGLTMLWKSVLKARG